MTSSKSLKLRALGNPHSARYALYPDNPVQIEKVTNEIIKLDNITLRLVNYRDHDHVEYLMTPNPIRNLYRLPQTNDFVPARTI